MNQINILVTLDEGYLPPLYTLLKSIQINNPGESFHIYMIYDSISAEKIEKLSRYCKALEFELSPIEAKEEFFSEAPVLGRFPRAMYYRLLAHYMLPGRLKRALYLDPDILVLNRLRSLFGMDITGYLFAGAAHADLAGITEPVNKIRMRNYEMQGYVNTGVLLFNLELQRKELKKDDVYQYIDKHKYELLLPDQDILNGLYGQKTLLIDDSLYNYDSRHYGTYNLMSDGEKDMDWVMNNTVVLHFCGKAKPWKKSAQNRFAALYKHYAAMVERTIQDIKA